MSFGKKRLKNVSEHAMSKSSLLKRTMPYIRRCSGLVFFTILLCFVIAILSAITPFITKEIVDVYLPAGDYKYVIIFIVLYVSITVVLFVSRYIFAYVNNLTGMKIEKAIREEAMAKINVLPVDYFSLEPDGKIVAKITSDSEGVRKFYITFVSIFSAVLNIIIVYVGVLIMNWMVGLLFIAVVPLLLLWITGYRKWIHKYHIQLRELRSRITGKLNENITGALIIQDYNLEDKFNGEYDDITRNYVINDRKASFINNTFGYELLMLIKRIAEIGLLMYLGFSQINVGGAVLTLGLLSALVDNLDKMVNPFSAIFDSLNELEDSLVGATRCYNFIDEINDTRIFDGETELPPVKGEIDFNDIHFSYVPGKEVLKGITLHVDAGKTIGIVGHTGSGKSSLMNLLLAYNDYDSGSILLDGNEITKYNKLSYRENMGIVLQTPAIFSGTLKSNVTMEREYSDEEVINALKYVGADYLINRTEDGIYMPISFRGENLSLGEKQLIAFARILIRNPKVLVLDEATANIDSETEVMIQNAMRIVSANRTTFIIAHRLSTIKHAHEIIVLDHGVIVGKGTHDSLYNDCKQYKDMYDSQYRSGKNEN